MVPIGSVASFELSSGPQRMPRYNLYPAAEIMGDVNPGFSSGEAIAEMEKMAEQILPPGFNYEWTELSYLQKRQGNTAMIAFAMAILFAYLVLAAQYESLMLPVAVLLIVPFGVLSSMVGVGLSGQENSLLTQIGLIVLIGLSAKNAILIVEFARQLEDEGLSRFEAAVRAAKLRLRPILMTSFSFVLGVMPLVFASGAGAEMRQAIGMVVFSGMVGVAFLGLVYTPVFYVICRKFSIIKPKSETAATPVSASAGQEE